MKKSLVRVVTIILFTSLILGGLSIVATARPLGATSPTLGASASYSVLAFTTVTNTGPTTISGDVGVASGTEITGFPPGVVGPPGSLHSNDASAIAAQADNLIVFGALDQPCDQSFDGVVELSTTFPEGVEPGVYCSTESFALTGNLTLLGSGVWIFKSVAGLNINSGASITGGDPCNVWWRVGSSATLDTNASLIGNIFALTSISLNTGATLNGRAIAQTGAVTLDSNTIQGPICALQPTSIPPTSEPTSTGQVSAPTETPVVPGLPESGGAPIRSNDFPWGLAIVGSFSVLALAFGIRAYRGSLRP